MPGSSWIIALLVLGWWAVQAIVSAMAKKQEQQRQRELAERRRQIESQAGGGMTSAGQRPPTAISQPRPATRDDLAARRQAQLEELRRRRMQQARGGAGAPATARVPAQRTPSAPTVPGNVPPTFPSRSKIPGIAKAPPPRGPVKQPVRVGGRPPQPIRPATAPPKPARQPIHKELHGLSDIPDVIKAGGIRPTVAPTDIGVPISAIPGTKKAKPAAINVGGIKQRLGDPKALRELFVMKELLDPPVALRDQPVGIS